MSSLNRFRSMHWLLAGCFAIAYATGDDAGIGHVWLGYAVIVAVCLRLGLGWLGIAGMPPMWPAGGMARQLSAPWVGRLLIWVLLLGALSSAGSGMWLVDNGAIWQVAAEAGVPAAQADGHGGDDDNEHESAVPRAGVAHWVEEAHEVIAHGTLLVAGLHVLWLLWFRRSAVRTMVLGRRDVSRPKD